MHISAKFITICACVLFSACTTTAPVETPKPKIKIALALGGGAAKGFAHIGVIKVLEQNGIKADIITGTSAGAVIGSLYASGLSPFELQQKAINLDEDTLKDYTLSTSGFIKGEALQNYINKEVGNRPLEKLAIQFGAVATNRETGEAVLFRSGNTGQAVRASASIPNVFLPLTIGKNHYVDGGLVQPVPVDAARKMGADIVIAVDISARPKSDSGSGFLSIFDQSINIMSQVALKQQLKAADVVIQPNILQLGSLSFEQRHQAILEGEKAAISALPSIRKAIAAQK